MLTSIDLILGDAVDELQLLDSNFIDLSVTSPPYDDLRDYNKTLEWNEQIWQWAIDGLYYVIRDGGRVVWITQDMTIKRSKTGNSFRQYLYAQDVGFLTDVMIWNKPHATDTGSMRVRYPSCFEFMFLFTKDSPTRFNPIIDRVNSSYGRKKSGTNRQSDGSTKPRSQIGKTIPKYSIRRNVWNINAEMSNTTRIHPAQFSEQIAIDHIYSWSNQNDTVIDPFMGSGTVGVVCKMMGRNFIGIEKDPDSFYKAKTRINNTEPNTMLDYNPNKGESLQEQLAKGCSVIDFLKV